MWGYACPAGAGHPPGYMAMCQDTGAIAWLDGTLKRSLYFEKSRLH